MNLNGQATNPINLHIQSDSGDAGDCRGGEESDGRGSRGQLVADHDHGEQHGAGEPQLFAGPTHAQGWRDVRRNEFSSALIFNRLFPRFHQKFSWVFHRLVGYNINTAAVQPGII